MMAQAREFASMLCIAAIGCQALRLLVPRGALEKPVRMILSLFFLICLLLPVKDLFLFELPEQMLQEQIHAPSQRLNQSYNGLVEEAIEANMQRVIEARLQKMGVEGTNILVNVHAREDGSIDISGVEITLPNEAAGLAGQVKGSIEKEMELPCEVLISPEV